MNIGLRESLLEAISKAKNISKEVVLQDMRGDVSATEFLFLANWYQKDKEAFTALLPVAKHSKNKEFFKSIESLSEEDALNKLKIAITVNLGINAAGSVTVASAA
eukprot:COSAG01_NODE_19965_length_979_cov_1.195455_2_plen_105_part_00